MLKEIFKDADDYANEQVQKHNEQVFLALIPKIRNIKAEIQNYLKDVQNVTLLEKWKRAGAYANGTVNLSEIKGNLITTKMREALNISINEFQEEVLNILGHAIKLNNVQIQTIKGSDGTVKKIVAVYEANHNALKKEVKYGNFVARHIYANKITNLNAEQKKPALDATYLSVTDQYNKMKRKKFPYVAWENSDNTWTKIRVENASALAEFYIYHFYLTEDNNFAHGYPSNFIAFFFGRQSQLIQQVDNQSGFFVEDVYLGLVNGKKQFIGVKAGDKYGLNSIVEILKNLTNLEHELMKGKGFDALMDFQSAASVPEASLQQKVSVDENDIITPEIEQLLKKTFKSH